MPNKKNQYDDEPRGTTRYGMDGWVPLSWSQAYLHRVELLRIRRGSRCCSRFRLSWGVVLVIYEAYRATSTDLAARAKENQALSRRFKARWTKRRRGA